MNSSIYRRIARLEERHSPEPEEEETLKLHVIAPDGSFLESITLPITPAIQPAKRWKRRFGGAGRSR